MNSRLDQLLRKEIEKLKGAELYRILKRIESPMNPTVVIEGRELILFSSNNYLGLATHPKLKEASLHALNRYGTGSGASRLISGNMDIHEELERRIAQFKNCEAAIVFPTGYMANIGLITSLAGKGDLILSDELNHASIIDGCRLSGADIQIYPHKDAKALWHMLSEDDEAFVDEVNRKRIIITDGVFSMDGDIASLPDILRVAEEYDAFVIVDDAHSTGVLGEGGRGTAEHYNISNSENLIQMGTFSKALGGMGGFVAGSEVLIDYLKNRARCFVYSTALPPSVCASSIAAIDLIDSEPGIRQSLWRNVGMLIRGLHDLGYDTMGSQTHIVPILIRDTGQTMKFAQALIDAGIYAPGIRPPTVPEKMSRIRVSLMASHNDEHINRALTVFQDVGRRLSII
ncbi:MAG: 8-amino-7-oxononanoate synthase [Spirochaetota bacterium]|nr:8-amino-7-oxononanoate synthase [Spirochaetota bacterium]